MQQPRQPGRRAGKRRTTCSCSPNGVDGYLSTFLTFKPEIAWRHWDAVQARDLDAATQVIHDFDIPFFDHILGYEGGFDAAIHGIDEIRGRGQRYRRPPYHSLTDKQLEELAEFLRSHGML